MRKAINQNHNIIKFRRKEEALGAILKLVICLGESNLESNHLSYYKVNDNVFFWLETD